MPVDSNNHMIFDEQTYGENLPWRLWEAKREQAVGENPRHHRGNRQDVWLKMRLLGHVWEPIYPELGIERINSIEVSGGKWKVLQDIAGFAVDAVAIQTDEDGHESYLPFGPEYSAFGPLFYQQLYKDGGTTVEQDDAGKWLCYFLARLVWQQRIIDAFIQFATLSGDWLKKGVAPEG